MRGGMEAIYHDVAEPVGFSAFMPMQEARGSWWRGTDGTPPRTCAIFPPTTRRTPPSRADALPAAPAGLPPRVRDGRRAGRAGFAPAGGSARHRPVREARSGSGTMTVGSMRQGTLRLGAFFYATGHHVAGWRHPSSEADGGLVLERYVGWAQRAEAAKFDLIFLEDGSGIRDLDLRSSEAHRALDPFRAPDAAVGPRGGDEPDRSRRHHLHQLQRALQRRAPVRLPRPSQRRARRLEPRDLRDRRGGGEFRRRPDRPPCRPLRACRGVRGRGPRPVEHLGRRRRDHRSRERPVLEAGRLPPAEPSGQAFRGPRTAQHLAHAAGPARAGAGRLVGARQGSRGAHRRDRVHGEPDAGGGGGLLRRPEGAHGPSSAARPTT